jgi:hypothetical protein
MTLLKAPDIGRQRKVTMTTGTISPETMNEIREFNAAFEKLADIAMQLAMRTAVEIAGENELTEAIEHPIPAALQGIVIHLESDPVVHLHNLIQKIDKAT